MGKAWSAVVFIVALLLFGPLLLATVQGDQSVYAYIGSLVAKGGVPYRDGWDIKPPLVYFQYALPLVFLPGSDVALQVFDWLLVVAGGLVAGRVAGRAGRSVAVVAAIAYVSGMQAFVISGYFGQPELACGLLTGLLYLLAEDELVRWRALTFGVVLGLLLWYKPPYILFAAPIVWQLLRSSETKKGTAWLRLAAGFAAPAVLVVGFFAAHGSLVFLYEGVVTGPRLAMAARQASLGDLPRIAMSTFADVFSWMPVVGVLALIGLFSEETESKQIRGLAASGLVASLCAVVVQAAFLPYHWMAIVCPASILAGLGAKRVITLTKARGMAEVAVLLLLALVLPLTKLEATGGFWRTLAESGFDRDKFLAKVPSYLGQGSGRMSIFDSRRIAREIGGRMAPGETLLAFELHPSFNFYSDRRSPTRFLYQGTLQIPAMVEQGWRTEFEDRLKVSPPAVIALSIGSFDPAIANHGLAAMQSWPGLNAWFSRHYRLEKSDGVVQVYRYAAP